MTDKIVAFACMAALVAFVSVLVTFVKELDLMIVIAICIAVGVYDFWSGLKRAKQDGNDSG